MSVGLGETSDGYHTFNELYEHRSVLFIALMAAHPKISWYSERHHKGSEVEMYPGMFIAGMNIPTGQISYHLERNKWLYAVSGILGPDPKEYPPKWDGHSPRDVVNRIHTWLLDGGPIT